MCPFHVWSQIKSSSLVGHRAWTLDRRSPVRTRLVAEAERRFLQTFEFWEASCRPGLNQALVLSETYGYEPAVLRGGAASFKRYPPRVVMLEYTPGALERKAAAGHPNALDGAPAFPSMLRTLLHISTPRPGTVPTFAPFSVTTSNDVPCNISRPRELTMDASMEGINEELEGLFGDELDGLGETLISASLESDKTLLAEVEQKVKAQDASPWLITAKEVALLLEKMPDWVPRRPAANKLLDGVRNTFFVEVGSAALGKRKKAQALPRASPSSARRSRGAP